MDSSNNNVITPERYKFWLDDIRVLYKDGNYYRFIPTSQDTRIEQLNAVSRFFIYLFLIFIMFGRTDEWLYIPIIGLIFVIIMYNLFEFDEEGKKAELLRMKRKVKSAVLTEPEINYRTYVINEDGETRVIDIDAEEQKKFEAGYADPNNADSLEGLDTLDVQSLGLNFDKNTAYGLEAGYVDSNGDIQYGSAYDALTSKKTDADQVKYTLDEFRIYEKSKCRRPTKDNPFMNPSVDDFNKEDVPVACNADDEDIHDDMELKFNEDMYRDLEDVYNRKNSQRQFFTVAHNIPNDMEAFARWCYKMPETCKTDQSRCLRYQDMRTKY